jgi:hypothetical protein
VLPGPAVAGPIVAPLRAGKPNAPKGWPDARRHRAILFISDERSGVLLYDPAVRNGSPIGSITSEIDVPSGLAVDRNGALYVDSEGTGASGTVNVYPRGQSSPSLVISNGIDGPYGIGVDSKGNVFVSNIPNNTVTAYHAGQSAPYETISFSAYGQPVGIGIDANDNVWVACDTSNKVFEIPAGTTQVQDAQLTSLDGPVGIAFGKDDVMYVSNFAAGAVNIYPYGAKSPSSTITAGIERNGPSLGGFTAANIYFQSNQFLDVEGYEGQAWYSMLSGGGAPLGIASSPLVRK